MILYIIGSLIVGIIFSFYNIIPKIPILDELTTIVLCVMLFSIGIDIGHNKKVLEDIKKKRNKDFIHTFCNRFW